MPDDAPGSSSPLVAGTLLEGEDKARAVRAMFDAIAPRYDMVNRVMTFRMDVSWRRKTVAALRLAEGSVVLDLAAGTGDLCRDLQRGGMHPVGVDLSMGMLRAARTTAQLVHGDALDLPVRSGAVDGVTCGFALRNFTDLPRFLDEIARVVRPEGRIAILEVDEPDSPLLRVGHRAYFGRVVPVIGGLLSDPGAYRYLPRSIAYLPPQRDLLAMIEAAGFTALHHQAMPLGVAQLITATRDGR